MTDRPDDRPLSSEEMIKQAREDLSDRPEVSELNIDRDVIAEQVEEAMPSPRELTQPARPRRPERRMRRDSRPPSGFGTNAPAQRGVAIAVALALLIIGAAVFLAIASGTG